MRWKVDIESAAKAEISDQVKSGRLSIADLSVLKLWVSKIEDEGLNSVQTDEWHDHPLEGEWVGYRSAAFSQAGRVIYRVEGHKLIVVVVRVTATHNYRRK